MVKVSVDVPPARIGDGEKSLEIDGGRTAVRVAVPRLVVLVPLSVVETKPLTLECTPDVVAVTCTLTGQEPLAGMGAPPYVGGGAAAAGGPRPPPGRGAAGGPRPLPAARAGGVVWGPRRGGAC